jgi:dTDP-4-amino-4,6-dideoxygalactose transaminase
MSEWSLPVKCSPTELAIFGGAPAFAEQLHVGRPHRANRERFIERVHDILDRNWLSNDGPYVREFERRFAELARVRHCVAVCNGTIALEIATRALGLSGEVIVPAFTFVATAHALQWQNITPIFCDVDPRTHNIDSTQVPELITSRTTGIIGVHLWGRPCDAGLLADIARRHGLKLLFDAAHAVGCSCKGTMVGNFGNAEIFSFHATKCLNTLEGGGIVTNDDELASRLRAARNFGFTAHDEVSCLGTNGKMSEISAAMGLTGLESLSQFIAANRENYGLYRTLLRDVPGIRLLTYDETERCNYQYVVCEIDRDRAGLTRDQLVKVLQAENVIARRYFYPGCHRMEPYRSNGHHAPLMLPNTEDLAERVMALPTGTAIGCKEISGICELIQFAVANAPVVRSGLKMWQAA